MSEVNYLTVFFLFLVSFVLIRLVIKVGSCLMKGLLLLILLGFVALLLT